MPDEGQRESQIIAENLPQGTEERPGGSVLACGEDLPEGSADRGIMGC